MRYMRHLQGRAGFVAGIVVGLVVCLFAYIGLFTGFEYFLGDQLLSPIGVSSGEGNEIVIIAIDDESIGKIGQWPWPRATYAELLDTLSDNPPKIIGIDVLFAEESRLGVRDDDKLVKAFKDSQLPVVLASRESENITPLPKFLESENVKTGEVSLLVDPDGIVRRANLSDSFASNLTPNTYNLKPASRIAWAGSPGTFRQVPFWRVLEGGENELAGSLAGKIVLVGSTATDLHDEQRTAIDRGFAMPGVEIQANLVNMLTSGSGYAESGGLVRALLIILAAILPALAFMFLPGMLRAILVCLAIYAIILIITVIAWGALIALPILYPFLAWLISALAQIIYRYFGAESSKRQMRNLFAKYVSHDVLNEIMRNPGEVKLGGEEKKVSILFSDIRGFTTLSETMTPTQLTSFMNRYLTVMTDVILRQRGVVDKYIGDAIMAFWGAPIASEQHASDAILAAAGMSEALDKFNDESRKLNLPEIEIGIGINSGDVVAGNMGSVERMSYTIMGDAVNLASRLEGLTKNYGVRVIASEQTLAISNRLSEEGITTREIDRVRVKGKSLPVTIFEVIPASMKEEFENIRERFDSARGYYYKGDWDKCLKLLAEIETILPSDGPTKLLRERCLQFKVMSPPSWEGVYDHKSK
ncbi:MAG TPA: adenylate/guanylate cyclase domain-containing protein [Candidatus Paceibacterota bacterium]